MPSTLSLIRNIFPDARHRTTAIAIWSAGSSGGTALGPLVGGVLLERYWWGSVFLINVPVMAAVIVTGLWVLPESKNDQGAPVDLASAVLSVLAIVIFALAGLLYFFSQYLQLVRGYSTLRAGLTELPSSLASLVVAVVTAVVRRLGNGRALGSGLLMAAVGLIVVALGESYGGIVVICVGLLIIGAGIGLAFTVSTGAVLGAVPADRAGAASAISETGLELGVALGIAMLGTIQDVGYRLLLGRVPSGLPGRVAEAAEQSLATLAGAIDPGEPGQAELMVQAREAFTRAMQATAIIAAVILLGAGVMAARHVPATSETSEETS